MWRTALVVSIGLVAALGWASGALAQINLEDPIEVVDETQKTIKDTLDGTVDQVQDTVDQVQDAGGDVVGGAAANAGGSAGSVQEAVSGSAPQPSGGSGGSSDAGSPEAGSISGGGGTEAGAIRSQRARGASGQRKSEARGGSSAGARLQRTLASLDNLVYVPLAVRLSNDADGDGVYSEVETVEGDGPVTFQVVLANTAISELEVQRIREVSTTNGQSRAVCRQLEGQRLAPEESLSCRFTIPTSVHAGQRLVKLVEVDVIDMADPTAMSTVTDISVVEGPAEGTLGLFIRRGAETLATTGARLGPLLLIAAVLASVGALLIRLGSRTGPLGSRVRSPSTMGGLP
jgi:hypothetical protein